MINHATDPAIRNASLTKVRSCAMLGCSQLTRRCWATTLSLGVMPAQLTSPMRVKDLAGQEHEFTGAGRAGGWEHAPGRVGHATPWGRSPEGGNEGVEGAMVCRGIEMATTALGVWQQLYLEATDVSHSLLTSVLLLFWRLAHMPNIPSSSGYSLLEEHEHQIVALYAGVFVMKAERDIRAGEQVGTRGLAELGYSTPPP